MRWVPKKTRASKGRRTGGDEYLPQCIRLHNPLTQSTKSSWAMTQIRVAHETPSRVEGGLRLTTSKTVSTRAKGQEVCGKKVAFRGRSRRSPRGSNYIQIFNGSHSDSLSLGSTCPRCGNL